MTDTGRRPTTRPGTNSRPKTGGRVRLAPPAPPTPVPAPPRAPWWWPIVSGVLAGVIAVGLGLLLTLGRMQPDPFAMALFGSGIALIAGGHVSAVTRAVLGPVARALAAPAEKDNGP